MTDDMDARARVKRLEAENARLRDALGKFYGLSNDLLCRKDPKGLLEACADARKALATPPLEGEPEKEAHPIYWGKVQACEFHDRDFGACAQYSGQIPCEPKGYTDEAPAPHTREQTSPKWEPPSVLAEIWPDIEDDGPEQAHGDALAALVADYEDAMLEWSPDVQQTKRPILDAARQALNDSGVPKERGDYSVAEIDRMTPDYNGQCTASGVPEEVRRLPEHIRDRFIPAPTEETGEAYNNGLQLAAELSERAIASAPAGEVVVTTNEDGECVSVTRQDSEGQILSVIWERESAPADGWQPIDTAPKDGNHIQLWRPDIQFVGYYAKAGWCANGPVLIDPPPTHWKPLAAAPQRGGEHE